MFTSTTPPRRGMPHHARRFRGFTLIELMVAMLLVSILAMVGLPSYQNYRVRARVTQDFPLISKAKLGIEEFYTLKGRLPRNNKEAGIDDWSFSNFKLYVGSFGGYDATIVLVFNATEIPELRGFEYLMFHAEERRGRLVWKCNEGGNMPNKYRPASCRI